MYSYRLKKGFTLDTSESYRVAKDGSECAYLWLDNDKVHMQKLGWVPASENFDWKRTRQVRYDPSTNKLYHMDPQGCLQESNNNVSADLDRLLVRDTPGLLVKDPIYNKTTRPPTKKETMLENIIATNKTAATQAAYLEAGRLANATAQNILFKKFPSLPQTPFNALVVANLADVIGKQIKPSPKLQKITTAMVTQAYAEVYQLIDLEGMIGELLNTVGDQFDNAE